MAGDTDNFLEDIELRIDPDPFCTSCHISSMKKKARSKNPLTVLRLSISLLFLDRSDFT